MRSFSAQTAQGRTQRLLNLSQHRVSHLQSEVTKLKQELTVFHRQLLEVEKQLAQTTPLPDFLDGICSNTRLQGDMNNTRQWSASAISLAFVLETISAKAYRFLKKLFALLLVALIYQRMREKMKFSEETMLQREKIPSAVHQWRL
jgi:hypothetical protein